MRTDTPRLLLGLTVALLPAGCYEEPIREVDLVGTVRIPTSLAPESRDLGVVYVGVFPGFSDDVLGYPYPEMGPVVGGQRLGDTYPYGGTTVGSYAYACYQNLKCQVITGRHADLEDIICRFGLTAEEGGACTCTEGDGDDQAIDEGSGCLSVDQFWDDCSWYYGYTSIDELNFVGGDLLGFTLVEDGGESYWEAEYRVWHVVPFVGAVVYAFVDNDRTSCNPEDGAVNRRYAIDGGQFFYEGTHFSDVLNYPDKYLGPGDLLSSQPAVLDQALVDSAAQGDEAQTERSEIAVPPIVLDYPR